MASAFCRHKWGVYCRTGPVGGGEGTGDGVTFANVWAKVGEENGVIITAAEAAVATSKRIIRSTTKSVDE